LPICWGVSVTPPWPRHELTRLPASKLKKSVAELLKAEGYVSDVRQEEWGPKKHQTLTIVLKYSTTGSNERYERLPRHSSRVAARSSRVRGPPRNPARAVGPRDLDPEHVRTG